MVVSVLLEEGPVEVELENPGAGVPMPRTPGGWSTRGVRRRQGRPRRAAGHGAGERLATGRLAFFGEPLAEAVAAMNRYTRRPIVILDPEIAQMPISGNYSVGDPQAFATSISVLLPVRVDMERNRITLRRTEENRA